MIAPSPDSTLFYTMESAIKGYRKFSQKRLSAVVTDMTIDQGNILGFLAKYPEKTQQEIAAMALKDNASMTRMLDLMERKGYLTRSINKANRRRFIIKITPKGYETLELMKPIILENRGHALQGLSTEELTQLQYLLAKINTNCISKPTVEV
ncbi:MarR family winged helix-turn-helix transcriptional regulator [Sediminicola luteus]|uniref:HTH marR-type domain-containing protein n=1 Tax=Sediminicola luteus TaxID=319238 RepID=A0A2A4G5Z4_9FLAO|nr:MarR family transcriptional regulator [Sediminicola luteus]PCE64067.1 hypothetical protein B7P33_12570 [Sediminicola luteus]